jgi:general secretion pathway protein F
MVYRELAALVGAGIPLVQALETILTSPELGPHRAVLAAARDRVREGDALAGALAGVSGAVTPLEQAIVEVGERAGALDAVLDRLATFLEEQQKIRESVTTALIYPALVLLLALTIGTTVLGVMVPRVATMLEGTSVQLPALTVFMTGASRFFTLAALPVLAALLGGWALFRRRLAADPGFRVRVDRFLLGLPLWGRAYTALVNLRFARTLAMLLKAGVDLVDGLALSARATGSPWVVNLAEESVASVRHGTSLADALRGMPPLSASLPPWVEAGESSGNLEGMLACAADRCQQQWERIVRRFLAALEPVLVLVIGAFVLLVALSILLPILSINKTIM